MRLIGSICGLSEKFLDEKKKALKKALNIDHLSYIKAKVLSGGSKRKLCIALALLYEPELIILDEPTCGLDPISRRNFCKFLKSLKDTTTIFVS